MAPERHQTFFVAKHYLKNYNTSADDLLTGIVDGGGDCGIDGIYFFANSLCIRDDTPLHGLGRKPRLDLVLVQVKNTTGFTEPAIDKLIVHLPKILDFDRDESELERFVNPRLIEVSRRFLEAYRTLDMPDLHIYVAFASLKAAGGPHPRILDRGDELAGRLVGLFSRCAPTVSFYDAADLCTIFWEAPVTTRSLQLAENPISTDTAGGYVGVVRLQHYEKFITREDGELDATLFEANVRDYEGETVVNRSIQETLETADPDVDFWWLNNGVTIVASKVQAASKLLELESPQIVNGLQTSIEIYKRRHSPHLSTDNRSILVKVIEARKDDVRERIIRATNSQTAFGPSALRATDVVQRRIEEYLGGRGLYYERRRHYYLNQNFPIDRIVSIDRMGQALLSVFIQKPEIARGNPSKIFENDIYEQAFSPTFELSLYGTCLDLLRTSTDFLTVNERADAIENYEFHLAMLLGMAATGSADPGRRLGRLPEADLPHKLLKDLYALVRRVYRDAAKGTRYAGFERVAKDPQVTAQLKEEAWRYLRSIGRAPDRTPARGTAEPASTAR